MIILIQTLIEPKSSPVVSLWSCITGWGQWAIYIYFFKILPSEKYIQTQMHLNFLIIFCDFLVFN